VQGKIKMVSKASHGVAKFCVLATFLLCNAIANTASVENAGSANTDYVARLNELVKKGSDENLNAEPCYRKSLELYVDAPVERDPNIFARWPTELTDVQQTAVRKWIDANSDAFAQLRFGTQRPFYWFRYDGSDVWKIYETRYVRSELSISGVIGLRAKLSAIAGNIQGALQDVAMCCRLGSDVKKRLFWAEQVRGLVILRYGIGTGFQVLSRSAIDRASLDFLWNQLVEGSRNQNLIVDLAAEQLVTLAAIQRIYAEWPGSGGTARTRVMDELVSSLLSDRLRADFGIELSAEQMYSSVYTYTPEEMENLVQKVFAYCNSLVSKTPFEQHENEDDRDKSIREVAKGNVLVLRLLPPVLGISEMGFRCQAERDALITTLGLMRYRKDKGGFPAGLQEMISGRYICRLPLDPYSDKPLVYKRMGESFVLYSVGTDFQNNGGRHSPKWGREPQGGDYVFWPVQEDAGVTSGIRN